MRLLLLVSLCMILPGCDEREGTEKVTSQSAPDELRLITLAPHLAELVHAAGAGDLLVGVSSYTDYPVPAASLPVVGDAFSIDQEQLTVLEPDLLLAWDTGTPAHVIDDLRSRGFRVEVITTTELYDVPTALRQIGSLTGHEDAATSAATDFENSIRRLGANKIDREPIRVFYQVDARPLYTINGNHYLSQLIEVCGGTNIFADLSGLAPLISVEAVLERDPEVMLASTDAGPQAFDEWQRWPGLAAVRYDNQFLMPANEIGRATPRLLTGAAALCDALAKARENRARENDD